MASTPSLPIVSKPVQPYHVPSGTASHADITVALDHAYADAMQTVIYIRLRTTVDNQPAPVRVIVSDENGNVYWATSC